jgi:murein DD-endopeptidase MepM/ murein hydrolase activator NlpD
VVTQEFGPTDFALEPAYAGFAHFHTGIDIAGPMGTPVLAADDGVVVSAVAGTVGYGNYVMVASNGGIITLYGHLEQASVAPGDRVGQGQQIGLEGSTGASTGPHCHFEVRVDGQPVDPRTYLPAGAPSATRA